MLLPAEQEVLRASGISRNVVDAFSALMANRPVCVAKVTTPTEVTVPNTGATLISWVATNGALNRGTMVRAVLWGSFTIDTTAGAEVLRIFVRPKDATDTDWSVSSQAAFDNGVNANFGWCIEVWWRLSGSTGNGVPSKAATLNVNAALRFMIGSDVDGSDSFSGATGSVPTTFQALATRFTAGHDIDTGKPQTFDVFFRSRNGKTSNMFVHGGWMEVL